MRSFVAACKYKPDTQAFVNLGLVHRNHEWIDYWHDWAHWMSSQGWQKRGWYVWDKLDGIPTVPLHGRLYNCHEFVFHFSRSTKIPRKTTVCKHAGTKVKSISMTGRQGIIKKHLPNALTVQSHRIADSVTRVSNRGKRMKGQVAHFPVGLPAQYIESFSSEGEIVHDPFCGSGTTIVAADTIGRVAYGMEISPNYCQIAVDRYWRHKEKQKA